MINYHENYSLENIVYFCEIDNIWKTEVFKDVTDYEGMYQVSDLGRVKSLERKVVWSNSIMLKKERILKSSVNADYLQCVLYDNKKKKTIKIHRIVLNSFLKNTEEKDQINHINGLKKDNRLFNLEWCTNSENQKHAIKTGLKTIKKGVECSVSKLNEKQVLEIRKIGRSKTLKEISFIYKVDQSTISLILLRKIWKHI